MAISRLLRHKPWGLHFNGRGLTPSTNSYSFSSFPSGGSEKSSFSKGLKASKEVEAGDKEQKKESWTWFNGIVSKVKRTMLGSSWFQKSIPEVTSESKFDTKTSEVTVEENSSHCTKSLESVSVPKSPEVVMSSPGDTEGVSSCSASDEIGGNSFEDPVVIETSEVCRRHGNLDSVGLGDVQLVQPPERVIVSHDKLRTFATDVMVENSKKKNKSKNLSDIFGENLENDVNRFGDAMSNVIEAISKKPGTNESSEVVNHLPGTLTATFVRRPSSKSGKNHASSKSSSETQALVNIMRRIKHDPTAGEEAGYMHDTLAPIDSLKEKKIKKKMKTDAITEGSTGVLREQPTIKAREGTVSNATDEWSNEGFLNIVKNRPPLSKLLQEQLSREARGMRISNVSDQHSNGGFLNYVPSPAANMQNSEVKGENTLLKQHHMNSGNEMPLDKKEESSIPTECISGDEEHSSLNLANSNHVKSGPNSHVSHPVSREELNSHSQTCCLSEGCKDNKVLVRFLPKNVEKQHILAAFSDCGPIVNVEELSSTKEGLFKDCLVQFETRKGFEIALKKNDLMIMNAEVYVEPTSSEVMDDAISFPDQIGDPEAPIALLKNPTKTVKIKNLFEDISSQKLKEALAFCHSDISYIFLGSTSSAAYVEFETEDAKERALAQQFVLVSGKELPVLRIDSPMTTVVRISNINPNSKIQKICNSYGQVKHIVEKTLGIADVYFKLAELPNMLDIVNSLNGIAVDGNRWLARPAPVFPPEILRSLLRRPEGRRHVNAVFNKLLREIEKPISSTKSSQLTDLVTRYYGKRISTNQQI